MNPSSKKLISSRNGRPLILNRPVFQGDLNEFISSMSVYLQDRTPQLIVTANVDHLIDLDQKTTLLEAYKSARIRIIDGMPVLWLLKLHGAKNISRITGAELIFAVPEAAEKNAWRIALTGGSNEVLAAATSNLRKLYPKADIVSVDMPFLETAQDPSGFDVVEKLVGLQPDITFICLGAPKQEDWFMKWADQLPAGLYIGAGAGIDFAAETKKRAPLIVQGIGFEWAWRLCQEFSRLAPRYLLKGPKFLKIIFDSFSRI